ncbi:MULTISPECIES: head completion/stabilization protein [Pseudomonas]|uniref:head completion/stabilization protein n=1 Tax=Pseudomonas TaxID=286 RepID=UPI0021F13197|nr:MULTISPECIES: head completion/stabilization protein [Pseudomonas]MCV6429360.1 head completion/stabilization protein [Pseudomonas aeruginosa]MCV6437408.1 head completion/stabilization protein [Pseudomonas aeruginosa]MCW5275451.1 head completion/stabilization protein [Pseudomonas aeruginosa]MDU4251460.1 head completion/stabilization protein [Pseudomonas sp.]
MSAFVASGDVAAGVTINSDNFWPGIDVDDLRDDMRIGADVSPAKLETAVVAALLNVNRQLGEWQAMQEDQGYTALSQVPAKNVNDTSALVLHYQRAVRCATAAELLERYRGYDTTNIGNQNAEERTPTIDEYRRDLSWALSDLVGRPRSTIELI